MKLYEVISSILNIDATTLSEESNALNTSNWDSLRHIEIMLAVENAFGVRFSMPEMVSMQNIGDMRKLICEKGGALEDAGPEQLSA